MPVYENMEVGKDGSDSRWTEGVFDPAGAPDAKLRYPASAEERPHYNEWPPGTRDRRPGLLGVGVARSRKVAQQLAAKQAFALLLPAQ